MHYQSSTSLLGIPLVHIAIGPRPGADGVRGIARGWIAVGDMAFGIVFAFGGLAVGGIGVGGTSAGVVALAGLSIGVWSFGGLALGVFALGGGAIAVWAANGGLAIAREYAIGGLAIAANANNETARNYIESTAFFSVTAVLARHSRWLLVLAIVAPIITVFVRRQRGRAA